MAARRQQRTPAALDRIGDGRGGLWDGRSEQREAAEAQGTEDSRVRLHPATKKIGGGGVGSPERSRTGPLT